MSSRPGTRARQLAQARQKLYELKPGEKMARITIELVGARVDCIVPGCTFWVHVPPASRTIMEAELKQLYRDHRKWHHLEYEGRTLYEFTLAEDYPRNGQ